MMPNRISRGSLNSFLVATKRLYYTDSYLPSFQANVTQISEDGTGVSLDCTAFYPTSGGQPHDLGVLNGIPVIDVVDAGEDIIHKLASPMWGTPVGGTVDCIVDWRRRYDHMQQHTGQHLLSAVFLELFGFKTLSFHMGAEVSTIELSTAELSETQIEETQLRAALLSGETRPVVIHFEDAAESRELRKASTRTGSLRIVEIEGIDRSACGGTHVRNSAEIGPTLLRRQEKIRANIRIEFVSGGRALRFARQDFRRLNDIAKTCSVSADALLPAVQSLTERVSTAEKARLRLSTEIARRDGRRYWDETAPSDDGIRRAFLTSALSVDELRALAQSYIEGGKAAILIAGTNPPSVLFSVSDGLGLDAGGSLKSALGARGYRGGGSRTLAQGSVRNVEDGVAIARELGFVLPD
jgi:alanyl-tRNA synthetase